MDPKLTLLPLSCSAKLHGSVVVYDLLSLSAMFPSLKTEEAP